MKKTFQKAEITPKDGEQRLSLFSLLFLKLLSIYQRAISPLFPPTCRFQPTCSQYAVEVIRAKGVAEGLPLAVGRLLRCHPFQPGGYDPPPIDKSPLPESHR